MNLRHHCGVLLEGMVHECDQRRCGVQCLILQRTMCGGIYGVGDVDIEKTSGGKVGGVVSLSQTDILFEIGFSGYRRVHAASKDNRVR